MFHAKIKILKFRTKIAFFGVLRLELEKSIAIFELTPSNLSECKVLRENKNPYV